jgi:hypothetical protein
MSVICVHYSDKSSSMIKMMVARTKNADWTWKKISQRLNGHGGTFIVEPHIHILTHTHTHTRTHTHIYTHLYTHLRLMN